MRRVWVAEYGGKHLVPVPDAAFLRWRVGLESGALCPAAYDGTNLVGSVFSLPHSLRIGSSVYPVALYTALTVDPDHRRLALPMVEHLRRHSEERGIAFAIGMVPNDPSLDLLSLLDEIRANLSAEASLSLSRQLLGQVPAAARADTGGARDVAAAGRPRPGPAAAPDPAWSRSARAALPRGGSGALRTAPGQGLGGVRLGAGVAAGAVGALPRESPRWGPWFSSATDAFKGWSATIASCWEGREAVRTALIDLWADDLTAAERVRLVSHLCSESCASAACIS